MLDNKHYRSSHLETSFSKIKKFSRNKEALLTMKNILSKAQARIKVKEGF